MQENETSGDIGIASLPCERADHLEGFVLGTL